MKVDPGRWQCRLSRGLKSLWVETEGVKPGVFHDIWRLERLSWPRHQKWKRAQWGAENISNDNTDDQRWLTVNGETLNPGGNAKYVGNQLKLQTHLCVVCLGFVFRKMVTITINELHQFVGIVLKQSF